LAFADGGLVYRSLTGSVGVTVKQRDGRRR
jgi:hypothetical protein